MSGAASAKRPASLMVKRRSYKADTGVRFPRRVPTRCGPLVRRQPHKLEKVVRFHPARPSPPGRLRDRTPVFHAGNTGASPVQAKTFAPTSSGRRARRRFAFGSARRRRLTAGRRFLTPVTGVRFPAAAPKGSPRERRWASHPIKLRARDGNGIRARLRCACPSGIEGSIPSEPIDFTER